jgi:hypothetical protein
MQDLKELFYLDDLLIHQTHCLLKLQTGHQIDAINHDPVCLQIIFFSCWFISLDISMF